MDTSVCNQAPYAAASAGGDGRSEPQSTAAPMTASPISGPPTLAPQSLEPIVITKSPSTAQPSAGPLASDEPTAAPHDAEAQNDAPPTSEPQEATPRTEESPSSAPQSSKEQNSAPKTSNPRENDTPAVQQQKQHQQVQSTSMPQHFVTLIMTIAIIVVSVTVISRYWRALPPRGRRQDPNLEGLYTTSPTAKVNMTDPSADSPGSSKTLESDSSSDDLEEPTLYDPLFTDLEVPSLSMSSEHSFL